MLSFSSRGCLVLVFAVLIISQAFSVCSAEINEVQWREASPTRVIIRSTADWARVLFDDLNGTNSNGLRIKSVISSGWLEGKDSNDQLYAGRKIAWPDTEFDTVVARKGDMVAFFKGLGDFHYTEVYADLVLEVNIDLPRVYLWLMTGGNGTTSFEIVNKDNGGTLWRDIVVASGETQQVKRVMSPQPFFQPGRAESSVVVTWLTIGIAVMLVLNFPILENLLALVRRITRSRARARDGNNRGGHDRREEATEQK
jgi:hypothetical protein